MFDVIKDWFIKIIKSREFVVGIIIFVFALISIHRLFSLQIVNGEKYLEDYSMSIEKEITVPGTRGNIYDRNGVLLAYNELGYNITLEDSGSYEDMDEKNESLNEEINTIISMIERNGDSIVNDMILYMDKNGNLSFLADDVILQGFRRDVYGHTSIDQLVVNAKLGYDEAQATPEQIYAYLIDKFGVDTEKYGAYRSYQIMVIRYALSLNSYQKYLSTDIAVSVSDETVAMIKEHSFELEGVGVSTETVRKYNYAEYMSHIVGYTGTISEDEYAELVEQDDSYTLNDTVGKSGVEQSMELELQGGKGSETVYVNNVGKILEVKESTDPTSGNNIYLSIDANLQRAVYNLLEQELAGIVYSMMVDLKEIEATSSDDIRIPIYDVYCALLENHVISLDHLQSDEGGPHEKSINAKFTAESEIVQSEILQALISTTPFGEYDEDQQEYITYVVSMLQEHGVFDADAVASNNETYVKWKNGEISVQEYLMYAIDTSWITLTSLGQKEKYADTTEIYNDLITYINEELDTDTDFKKLVFEKMVYNDEITGNEVCLILFDQGILEDNPEDITKLENNIISPYDFMREKIMNIEITPAQLALDPCTGSCVIMDPENGDLLACVTYPGYDTNRLANHMDDAYYNELLHDKSLPLYNNATQQTTAPGSTFKPVTTTAGLTEGVIDTSTLITDTGTFEKLGYNLHCWIYPSMHGDEDIVNAIADSCNYYFCEVGYRLSMPEGEYDDEKYNEQLGIDQLTKYASMYGLGSETGIEIGESEGKIADEYPISASIGQSDHSFTTIQLCRYAGALANSGTVYDFTLLDKITAPDDSLLEDFSSPVANELDSISKTSWNAIHQGMREMVLSHDQFDDLETELAGKTGTAQENKERPNHALFVGYAPMDNPQVAISVRIAYGYTSGNACDFVDNVMKYYFKQESEQDLLSGRAEVVSGSSNSVMD